MPKKHTSQKKQEAINLRREGYSYNEIASNLKVAKSSLGRWFNEYADLKEIKEANMARNREESALRIGEYAREQKRLLEIKYEQAVEEGAFSYETHKDEPLFVAGLMLYAGEGDRKSRSHIRISNTEWRIHAVFVEFCIKYMGYSREQMALGILAYNDLSIEVVETFWREKLNIHRLHKTLVIKGKGDKHRLQFGVAMTIINDTRAKYKLLKWIDLYLDENAAIV